MTHPDKPTHPNQAYVLTDAGARLKAHRANNDPGSIDGDRTDRVKKTWKRGVGNRSSAWD